ncbi:thioredoxin domain-containing protein [bacterium]|nr:thioredoxin domain-containing protein [bacterium]
MDYGALSRLAKPVMEHEHVQGPASAVVTLVEYGDYQCPKTRAAYKVVKKIQQLSGDWMRFVFRHFPMTDKHEYAQIAAEAVESAGAQGLFWEMHDYLIRHTQLDEGSLMDHAEEIGLDVDRFESDLADHLYVQRIKDDIAGGMDSGVTDTPAFFMNGKKYAGALTEDAMLEAIEAIADEIED